MSEFILASQSPRRKQLLAWADIDFDVIISAAEEDFPVDMDVQEVPVYIAQKKAIAVHQKIKDEFPVHQGKWIIAADTIVVLENEIIGKPTDRADAINILQKLSGKTHRVITGVYIVNEEVSRYFSETTLVHFHPLTLSQIEYYVDQYQPYDKAGCWGIFLQKQQILQPSKANIQFYIWMKASFYWAGSSNSFQYFFGFFIQVQCWNGCSNHNFANSSWVTQHNFSDIYFGPI
jgi:septum formation protein